MLFKCRLKLFAYDEISVQVSFFSQGQEWNIAELAFSQLADILSVASEIVIFIILSFLGTQEGITKFLETDGVYGKAAPDHDEL